MAPASGRAVSWKMGPSRRLSAGTILKTFVGFGDLSFNQSDYGWLG